MRPGIPCARARVSLCALENGRRTASMKKRWCLAKFFHRLNFLLSFIIFISRLSCSLSFTRKTLFVLHFYAPVFLCSFLIFLARRLCPFFSLFTACTDLNILPPCRLLILFLFPVKLRKLVTQPLRATRDL